MNLFLCILRMLEDIFSFGAAQFSNIIFESPPRPCVVNIIAERETDRHTDRERDPPNTRDYNVVTTFEMRVITLQRRCNDVVATLCVCKRERERERERERNDIYSFISVRLRSWDIK